MAGDSYIQVNEGSERKIDHYQRTIGGSVVDQPRVVTATPYAPTYVVVATDVALSAADSHILQLLGPSTNRLLLRELKVTQAVAANADHLGEWELRRVDTAGTGGTSVDVDVLDPVDSASSAAAMTLPSTKGTEDELLGIWTAAVEATLTQRIGQRDNVLIWEKWDSPLVKPPTLAGGGSTGFALVNNVADSAAKVHIRMVFEELAWS